MHIKHLTLMSGPVGCFPAGTEREIDDAEGSALVAGGYAIELTRRVPETATARAGETATAAEQLAAKHLKNVAAAGKGGSKKGQRTGGMTAAQKEEAARDAYAGGAPAAASSAPTSAATDSADASTTD